MLRLPRWLGLLVVSLLLWFDPEKWAIWDYRATVVNDATNSGNHTYVFTCGAGGVCILLGGSFLNGDTVALNMTVILRNNDNDTYRSPLPQTSVAGGAVRELPTSELSSDDGIASGVSPFIIASGNDLLAVLASVNVSDDSRLALQMLVSGGPPAVVITSPTGATETVTEDRIV